MVLQTPLLGEVRAAEIEKELRIEKLVQSKQEPKYRLHL
jgi:hypothetical protein